MQQFDVLFGQDTLYVEVFTPATESDYDDMMNNTWLTGNDKGVKFAANSLLAFVIFVEATSAGKSASVAKKNNKS